MEKSATSSNMSNPNALRSVYRILVPLFLVLGIGLATIIGLVKYSTSSLDQAMQEDLNKRVDIALRIEADHLKDLVIEYSYWQEAYDNLIVAPNQEWASEEIGAYLTHHQGVNLAFAVTSSGQLTSSYNDGRQERIDLASLLDSGLSRAVELDRLKAKPDHAESLFLKYNGKTYLLAVNLLIENYQLDLADGSYLVLGRRIDQTFLDQLSTKFELNGVEFLGDRVASDKLTKVLQDSEQNDLVKITWNDPAHKRQGSRNVAGLVLGITLIMSLLTLGVVLNELSHRNRLGRLLMQQAMSDPLTGIANRRAFFEKSKEEINRAMRTQNTLFLFTLDVDKFKSINDTYGHAAGDTVLIALSDLLQDGIRGFDLAARIGGEEFAILMSNTTQEYAHQTAERIREAIENLHIIYPHICHPVTVSVGIAQLLLGDSLPDLLQRADRALYVAKQSGRNQCVLDRTRLAEVGVGGRNFTIASADEPSDYAESA